MAREKLLIWLLAALALFGAACRTPNGAAPTQTTKQRASGGGDSTGATSVRSEIGFATRRKFLEHYEKHGAEFGSISQDEYLRQAQTLRDSPAGGNILEAVRADGVITRFDRKTGAFLAFDPDLTIRTYFQTKRRREIFSQAKQTMR